MSVYGRRSVPGERGVRGALDQPAVLNRTLRAQVSAVNPENGYVLITYESMPSGGKFVTVPPLWMSFPDSAAGGPAWGRYMPQQSDLVLVSSDYDDSPHIVGYDIVAGKANVADGRVGWPQLLDQYQVGKSGNDAKRAKFAQFTPLNPGEFDFMSSGGAYIYGNNKGRLYLAGGAVSIALVKNDLRINQRAQVWNHIADDCDIRFGQVRRLSVIDQIEKPITGGEDKKEFNITLKKSIVGGLAPTISTLVVGNITNDLGIDEITSTAGMPLRFSYKAYTDVGVEALHNAIDNMGNWEVSAPLATIGVNFDFSASSWITKFNMVDFTALTSYKVTSPSVTYNAVTSFAVNSPTITLGQAASHPLLMTNLYRPAEDQCLSQIVAHITTLHSAVTTIVQLLQVGGAASTPPVVGAIVMGKIFQAGAAALTGILASSASTAPTGLSVFTGQSSLYLSQIAKNA